MRADEIVGRLDGVLLTGAVRSRPRPHDARPRRRGDCRAAAAFRYLPRVSGYQCRAGRDVAPRHRDERRIAAPPYARRHLVRRDVRSSPPCRPDRGRDAGIGLWRRVARCEFGSLSGHRTAGRRAVGRGARARRAGRGVQRAAQRRPLARGSVAPRMGGRRQRREPDLFPPARSGLARRAVNRRVTRYDRYLARISFSP
ncbi:unnamed protein product [Adineta ricciae]|uniref:Uncharacterized protein n=1 Tax=Adineta ricciae TaxID=249248 RepID=A0A815AQI5_ADIRI|nr:unnamed protein product [Adineta ricciae]